MLSLQSRPRLEPSLNHFDPETSHYNLQPLHIIHISDLVSPPAKFRTPSGPAPEKGSARINEEGQKVHSFRMICWAILMLTIIFEMFTRLPEFAR